MLANIAAIMRQEHDAGDGHFSTAQVEYVEALVAQGIEQGSSKPEVTGSNPVDGATRGPNAWHCVSDREVLTTDREQEVREFLDRNDAKWTVTPLYNITTALRTCSLDQLEAEYVRRSQHTGDDGSPEGELVVTQYELTAARTALREIASIDHNCRSVDIARAALSRT